MSKFRDIKKRREGGSKKAREMKQGTDSERRSHRDKTREGEWAENHLYTKKKDTVQRSV